MFSNKLKLWRKSYDESLLKVNIQNNYQNMNYVSEGMHYRVYKWSNNEVDFAVYKAKDRFHEETLLEDWISNIERLQRIEHPWIPIIEHFQVLGETFVVQPYLESEISSIESYELKNEKVKFIDFLKKNNLEVDDVFQFRSSKLWGIQIHDWSDLKKVGM